MHILELLGTSWTDLTVIVLGAVGVYLTVIALTRLAGPRSLAKMSSFDFAATVAVGSTVASVAVASVPLAAGALALGMLFGLQYLVATLRRKNLLYGLVDNRPLLVMADGQVLEGNLRHARLSRSELWAQLRQSGVHSRGQVRAVVMETNGDLSVLRTGEPLDRELLEGVRGVEALR